MQRQEQQQQQSLPQTEPVQTTLTHVLAPTAALLAELLPLLTKSCLTGLEALWDYQQQHQQQRQQNPAVACQESSREEGSGRADNTMPSAECRSSPAPPEPAGDTCSDPPAYACDVRMAVQFHTNYLAALLFSSVVPQHTGDTATEVPTPTAQAPTPTAATAGAAAAEAAAAAQVPTARSDPVSALRGVPYSCVLHAQDTIMPHVVNILRVLEGSLRDAAADGAESADFLTDTVHWVSELCRHGA